MCKINTTLFVNVKLVSTNFSPIFGPFYDEKQFFEFFLNVPMITMMVTGEGFLRFHHRAEQTNDGGDEQSLRLHHSTISLHHEHGHQPERKY